MLSSIFRQNSKVDKKAELRAKIVDLREELNAQRQETRQYVQECRKLRAELAKLHKSNSKVRVDRRDVDTIGHNSLEGMDSFFQSIPNREPYELFGSKLKALCDQIGVQLDGRHILDAGVGPAIALKRFLEQSQPASVTGWDFSNEAIRHASEEMPDATMAQHDLMHSFTDRFDVIICTEVLEHLESPDIALKHLYEGLSPGGQLLLTVPDGRLDITKLHINFWSPESWRIFIHRVLPDADARFGTFNDNEALTYRNNYALLAKPA